MDAVKKALWTTENARRVEELARTLPPGRYTLVLDFTVPTKDFDSVYIQRCELTALYDDVDY